MDAKELENLLASAEIEKPRAEKAIKNRHYDLEVFQVVDGEKKIIYRNEYLTMRQARELKKEYLAEDGLRCDIIENVTIDRDGKELTFPERNPVAHVVGKQAIHDGLGTPAATERIIERQRRAKRNKAAFMKRQPHSKSGPTIRYTNSFSDPESPLFSMYMDNVRRKGFTVRNKLTRETFIGLQNEVIEYIASLKIPANRIKIDLDISFNGV